MRNGHIASLDDKAERHAPERKGSAWAGISIRNLLRMASGAKWSDKVTPGVQTDGAVERSSFLAAVLTAPGGRSDMYR